MRKEFCVYDKNGKILNVFSIVFVKRKTKDLKLDPEKFYNKFGNYIPKETIEMMVKLSVSFTIPRLLTAGTHLHKGNDRRQYICYPQQIDTIEEAIKIASDWCLITVFHMKQRADVAWFESFGEWIITATKSGKENVSAFTEFPLWIQNGWLEWSVKVL